MPVTSIQTHETQGFWADRKPAGTDMFDAQDLPRLVVAPGALVGETDDHGGCCYLIERGLVANYIVVDDNRPTCVGLAGPGDIVGLDTLFGRPDGRSSETRAVVPVQLLRIPVSGLREALNRSPALLDTCLQQLQANLTEIQHVAACNARHLLPSRCAHWLLRLQTRLGDVLPVTHEFLASVLGVRRAGITVTLQAMQRGGIIRQQRGSIVVIEAQRLRESACSCPLARPRPPLLIPAALPEAVPPAGIVTSREQLRERMASAGLGETSTPGIPVAVTRIDAILQVCRGVMERTQELLAV